MDDIYREALNYLLFFIQSPQWNGTSGQITPYCTTSKTAWEHRHMALLHRWCFYLLYKTALRSFVGLWQLVSETFTTQRGNRPPSWVQRGAHLIMALFSPHLLKCCRYEHNGKYLTSKARCVVYKVRHTFTKNWDLFLIFKTENEKIKAFSQLTNNCVGMWNKKKCHFNEIVKMPYL